jgi:outer membrane cobalamin receptor
VNHFFCLLIALAALFPAQVALSQSRYLHGYVTDSLSGEALVGAAVVVKNASSGTSANAYGFYSLPVPTGAAVEVQVSALGYATATRLVPAGQDNLNVGLRPLTFELAGVTVTGAEAERLGNQNRLTVEPQKIKELPRLLGEVDPMKFIQTLPGIKQGREGSAGLHVRGGTPDQNLILLDGIPIYNTNHLFGYLSVFNADAIRNIQIYKNGIPARYEGRLSSVIDIAMKEGNLKTPRKVFSLSPVAGTLMLEGPIKKEKSSYMIAVRRTWLDALLGIARAGKQTQRAFNFHDVSAKYQNKLNAKHSIFFSAYGSNDKFFDKFTAEDGKKSRYSFNWGNFTGLFRWNAQLRTNAFLNTSVYYSRYNFKQVDEYNAQENDQTRKVNSSITEWNAGSTLDYYPHPHHDLKTGVQVSYKTFEPEVTQIVNGAATRLRTDDQTRQSLGASLFVEDNIRLSGRALLELGLRTTLYVQGNYARFFPQPRVKFSYNLVDDLNVQASYDHVAQNIHLLTNTTLGQPTDLWLPATAKAPTERADQYNLSLQKTFSGYDVSVSAYYKDIRNVIEYQEGASILYGIDQGWEDKISVGKGHSHGVEWLVAKKAGKLTGHLAYTLSRSTRTFTDINNGKTFPFKYDRTHDASVLVTLSLSKRSKLSSMFNYNTGNAITLPVGKTESMQPPNWGYMNDPRVIGAMKYRDLIVERNNARMPAYHRLDVSYSHSKQKKNNRVRTWNVSVYNAYNRLNPYFIYESGGRLKQYAFFPVIPSVSYSLEF